MPPLDRPRLPTGYEQWDWIVTDDGSRTLFQRELNETYHSGCGAVAETLVVYLWHSGLLTRLRHGIASRIVEFGLGTATGFLLTAALAEHYRTPLTYVALENALLPIPIYRELQLAQAVDLGIKRQCVRPASGIDPNYALEEFSQLPRLLDLWCQALHAASAPSPASALPTNRAKKFDTAAAPPTLLHWQLSEYVQILLVLGDAANLNHDARIALSANGSDAIYFDPFSPDSNPDLWTKHIFSQANHCLKPGGTLVSYCVKSSVRRDLQACGFDVHKLPGPVGGKREVLLAHKLS